MKDLTPKTTYRVAGCLTIVSIIACTISFFSLFLALHSVKDENGGLDWDYMGVIVGILSFLVCLLVSWQIYSAIEVKEKIEIIKSDFEKKVTENEKSTNDVKAMVFSVCGDLLNIQYNNPLQSYEYYLYALRNYLFGGNKQPSVDRTLAKMKACLSAVKGEAEFQDMEMFYSILQEIKSSGKLNEKQFELLKTMENKREELKN